MNAEWETKRFQLSQPEIDDLLGELCTRLGYCSLTAETQRKLTTSPLTIDEFTDAVLVGESDEHYPPVKDRLRNQVRSLIASYYEIATNHGLWWLKFRENSN